AFAGFPVKADPRQGVTFGCTGAQLCRDYFAADAAAVRMSALYLSFIARTAGVSGQQSTPCIILTAGHTNVWMYYHLRHF
ncbi:MAG: hypothetical protein R3D62_20415, partial [Xanthobacteraceae bacterium]